MGASLRGGCPIAAILAAALASATPPLGSAPDPEGPVARVVHTGHIDCFEEGLRDGSGGLLYCETSAVTRSGNELVLANDKRLNPHSAIFAVRYSEGEFSHSLPWYLHLPPIMTAVKYEALTTTPDGAYIIASTGFDRVRGDSPGWDEYNTILAWPARDPGAGQVVSPSTAGGVTSSVGLRASFSRVLATRRFPRGVPYFKIEGLSAIPGGTLLFGIREKGAHYKRFDYVFEIVSVSYRIEDGVLKLGNDFALAYEYDPSERTELNHPVALSDLAYDPDEEALFVLTSFEGIHAPDELGGFLWELPLSALLAGQPPRLVRDERGEPLAFSGKPEGVTSLGGRRLFVVFDDDRVLGVRESEMSDTRRYRQPHQAVCTVLALQHADSRD